MKAFVDTNILIDLVCGREEFLDDAQNLFSAGYAKQVQLILSALSFVNTVYIGKKYKFSEKDIRNSLSSILSFVEVADMTGDVIKWAMNCDWTDYEDATQYQSAILADADCIITRNKSDYKESVLPVWSVSEFLEKINL